MFQNVSVFTYWNGGNVQIYMQKQLVERAIAKAGSMTLLVQQLGVTAKSVRRWWHGKPIRIENQAKLKTYLEG
jgi:hypothetical protein